MTVWNTRALLFCFRACGHCLIYFERRPVARGHVGWLRGIMVWYIVCLHVNQNARPETQIRPQSTGHSQCSKYLSQVQLNIVLKYIVS